MAIDERAPGAAGHDHWERDGFTVSTDPERIDREATVAFLAEAYWAKGTPRELLFRSIDNALVFGLYDPGGAQVGFARVVTDYARFAWLSDVFVLEGHRGRGLGAWLVEVVTSYAPLSRVQRFLLATADAHRLYEPFGFRALPEPHHFMVKENL